MRIEVAINDTVFVEASTTQIVESINELSMPERWNYLAQILNGIYSKKDDLSDKQKQIVKEFLEEKLKIFEEEVV